MMWKKMIRGPDFKMTLKTKIYLALYTFFTKIDVFSMLAQWFINHCDMEEEDVKGDVAE